MTYDLGTALSLTSSALAVAVVLTSGHGRGDGSEGGDGSEDGLELHFEVVESGVAEELKELERVVERVEWSGVDEWIDDGKEEENDAIRAVLYTFRGERDELV